MISIFALATLDAAHVKPVARLVGDLAAEAQVEVKVTGPLKRHCVLLNRRSLGPLDSLRLVAHALSATLALEAPGRYRLEPSLSTRKELSRTLEETRRAWLERAIRDRRQRRERQLGTRTRSDVLMGWATRIKADMRSGRIQSAQIPVHEVDILLPESELVEEVVKRIGLDALARIRAGSVQVYETSPVLDAEALPAVGDLLAKWDQQNREFQAADYENVRAQVNMSSERNLLGARDARPTVNLRLEVRCEPAALTLLLQGYDSEGSLTLESQVIGGPDAVFMQPAIEDQLLSKQQPEVTGTLPLDVLHGFRFWRAQSGQVPDWYAKPSEQEPLDRLLRTPLEAMVPNPSRPYAIDVPDGLVNLVQRGVRDDRFAREWVWSEIMKRRIYSPKDVSEGRAWRLSDPAHAESTWSDRKVLGQFSRQIQRTGQATIRDKAKLLGTSSELVGPLAVGWLQMSRNLSLARPTNELIPPPMYRFLGRISDGSWAKLSQGQVLTAGAEGLSEPLRELLNDFVADRLVSERPIRDLHRHPTELFAMANLNQTPIRFSIKKQKLAFVQSDARPSEMAAPLGHFFGSPVTYVYSRSRKEFLTHTTRESYDTEMSPYVFQDGVRTDLRAIVVLPQDVLLVGEYQGPSQRIGQAVRYADLPQERRDSMWNQANETGLAMARTHYNVQD